MSTNPPETNVSANKLPTGDRAGAFSLDVEERTIGERNPWLGDPAPHRRPGRPPVGARTDRPRHPFSQVSGRFFTKSNIGNIPGQGAYIAIIGLGLVFVLLLGEIDLSAGTAGGTCAAIAAVACSRAASCPTVFRDCCTGAWSSGCSWRWPWPRG